MKASVTILAAIFTIHAGILFAGNDNAPVVNENITISLAPSTPVEATFEDVAAIDAISLMPVTPSEASFEETPATLPSIADLSPVIPIVADFEKVVVVNSLAPVNPAVAEFE